MNTYLQVQAGPHQLLVDVGLVVEVSDATSRSAENRRLWRGRSLPVTDLVSFLGGNHGGRRQQVVLGGAEADVATEIIDVDHVVQLVDQPATAFFDVAPLSDALANLVEGACLDSGSGACLLRLRTPFAWHAGDAPAERGGAPA